MLTDAVERRKMSCPCGLTFEWAYASVFGYLTIQPLHQEDVVTIYTPDKAYALILVYAFKKEAVFARVDTPGERGVTSMSHPLHALTRIRDTEHPAWTEFKRTYPVLIDEYNEEDLPLFIRKQVEKEIGRSLDDYCVIARCSKSLHRLVLTERKLKECEGDLGDFAQKLEAELTRRGLTLMERSSPFQRYTVEIKKLA